MDREKKIEVLRRANAQLRQENMELKGKLKISESANERLSSALEELKEVKVRWGKALGDLEKQRIEYSNLIDDLKKLKRVKIGFDELNERQ